MYRGLARLVGMTPLAAGGALEQKIGLLREHWGAFDFFFLRIKQTDSAGEDGDFERKVAEIERVDTLIPGLMKLKPQVLIVTGDHSTPAVLKSHSWHPVPVLLWSPRCRPDSVRFFGERACMNGSLSSRLPAHQLMPLALANAGRLLKYGA